MNEDPMSESPVLRREALGSPVAATLIAELNEELRAQYPEPGANHFRLDLDEVNEGRGAFLVLYLEGRPVGCGAVRRIDVETAELKRMYVQRDLRGRGLGRTLLRGLEQEALRLGVSRLVLETGTRQTEAMKMYESAGFRRIEPFGEYVGSPLSVCMEKGLVDGTGGSAAVKRAPDRRIDGTKDLRN